MNKRSRNKNKRIQQILKYWKTFNLKTQEVWNNTSVFISAKKEIFEAEIKKRKGSLKRKVAKFKKNLIYKSRLYRQVVKIAFLRFLYNRILTFTTWSIIYFAFLFFISWKLGDILILSGLKNQTLQYFTTAGGMLGGILAIFFSLTLFVMQNAAESFSSGYYKVMAWDIWRNVLYFIISVSIVLLFAASLFTHNYKFIFLQNEYSLGSLSLQVSIFVTGLILYLIYLLYRRTFNRMQPQSAVREARDTAISTLDKISKAAKDAVSLMSSNPQRDPRRSNQEYMAYALQRVSPINYLNDRLTYLFDFHDKLLSKNERSLALEVLNAITDIIKKYFSIRSDSSVIVPTEYIFAVTSDSQAFLTPALERMTFVGRNYAKNDDGAGISKVIHLMKDLCVSASDIKYVDSGRTKENPIFEQCRGYLDQLTDSVIQIKNDEGVFQAGEAYPVIASAAIQKNYFIQLDSIYQVLDKLTFYSVGKRFEPGLTAIFDAYRNIINGLILVEWQIEHNLEDLFQHLETTVVLSFALTRQNTLRDRHFTQTEIAKPYNHLHDLIIQVSNQVEQSQGDEEEKWKSTLLEASEALRASLRRISETINSADHMLIWSFGRIIQDVGVLLLDLTTRPKWQRSKRELTEIARDYIYQTKWFSAGATAIQANNNYDELVEGAAQIGLKAIEVDLPDLAKEATGTLYNFATEMLQKQIAPGSGRTEPEIMSKACLIGILALKKGQIEVVDKLKQEIQQFQLLYEAKWFANAPEGIEDTYPRNQLKRDVEDLIRHRRERMGLLDFERDAEYMLMQTVDDQDIQRFINHIWPEASGETATS